MLLIINLIVVVAVMYYVRKHMNISREDENKLWCGYFLVSICRDISFIVYGIISMSSSAIISGLVGALITGIFLWYFAKSAKLI
jgi:hypothetical protein